MPKDDTLGEISDEVKNLVTYTYDAGGKTYGVGAVEATSGIIYNKEIFERYGLSVPQTYQDFLNICKTLKSKGLLPSVWAAVICGIWNIG